MAVKKTHILFGVALLADLAMTAVVFAKTCLPTLEELTDAAVEDAWKDLEYEMSAPIGFDEAPEPEPDEEERVPEFDRAYEEVMERPRKDPIDEGIDNILRYSVYGKTGFEPADDND